MSGRQPVRRDVKDPRSADLNDLDLSVSVGVFCVLMISLLDEFIINTFGV